MNVRVPRDKKLVGPHNRCPIIGCRKVTLSMKGIQNHGTRDHNFSFWTWTLPRWRTPFRNIRSQAVNGRNADGIELSGHPGRRGGPASIGHSPGVSEYG